MPALPNARHERFAQELAKGGLASELEAKPFDSPTGFYVYALVDPRFDRVFYIGKGKGERALNHERQARRGSGCNALKAETIRAILASGLRPQVLVLEDRMTNAEALCLERALIVRAHKVLTNISMGDFDEMERAKMQAKQCLSQIKPLCVVLKMKPTPLQRRAWMDITSRLARMSRGSFAAQ